MIFEDLIKPSRGKIIIFVVLVVLSYLFFANTGIEIFPCNVQPVVQNPPEPTSRLCGLGKSIGISISFTFTGYLLMVFILLILPYLLASILNYFLKVTDKNK